jgi:hypothetical protein
MNGEEWSERIWWRGGVSGSWRSIRRYVGEVVRNVRNARNVVNFKLSDDTYQFYLKVRHPLLEMRA